MAKEMAQESNIGILDSMEEILHCVLEAKVSANQGLD